MKNLHLGVSVLCLLPLAASYGVAHDYLMPLLFDFDITTVDQAHIMRSTMGLYLGMAFLWILGMLVPTMWYTATISNVVFMFGLGSGQLLSFLIDGMPDSNLMIIYFEVETALAIWGFFNLKRYYDPDAP